MYIWWYMYNYPVQLEVTRDYRFLKRLPVFYLLMTFLLPMM